MLMPTTSEFIALCRAQVTLLTQGLGASLSIVYLTRGLADGSETQLVPVIAYPETAVTLEVERANLFSSPLAIRASTPDQSIAPVEPSPRRLNQSQDGSSVSTGNHLTTQRSLLSSRPIHERQASGSQSALIAQRQLVLPLLHDGVVLGLLVVGREDRAWTTWEQTQIQEIANTLALACVLDQRYQWLEQQKHEQRQFQEQQRDLLDNLLHQFRNSLTALQTFSKLILKRLLPGDPNRDVVNSIAREAARLKELSQQLEATLQKQEQSSSTIPLLPPALETPSHALPAQGESSTPPAFSGAPPALIGLSDTPLPLVPCNLSEILWPLLISAQTMAQDRDLTLLTDLPTPTLSIQANPAALREAVQNVVENALKYTPAGGHIRISTTLVSPYAAAWLPETGQPWIELAISDTGPGIPAADLPHLFERRYRGVQAQSEIPGTGLGLAIARSLIQQMHGQIRVQSPTQDPELLKLQTSLPATPNPGTTVFIYLPAATPDPHPASGTIRSWSAEPPA